MKYTSQHCCGKTVDDKMTLYRSGGQTAAREPHAARRHVLCGSSSWIFFIYLFMSRNTLQNAGR